MKRLLLCCALAVAIPLSWADSTVAKTPPSWILNPNKDGYLSVVGFAPKQDWGGRDAQYRVAQLKARQELAQMIRVKITSTSKFSKEDRNGKTTQEADIETTAQSNVDLKLDAAEIINEWVDPKNEDLYIWLATKIETP